ncbi:MAG: hypothetical protein ACKOBJ_04025 [Actinomycetota bacterium]
MSHAGRFAACVVAAALGVSGTAPATATPSIGLIQEYPLPTTSSNPSWITGGLPVSANGDLWFTMQPITPAPGNTGAVAKITTSGVITQYSEGITPGSGPSSIADTDADTDADADAGKVSIGHRADLWTGRYHVWRCDLKVGISNRSFVVQHLSGFVSSCAVVTY